MICKVIVDMQAAVKIRYPSFSHSTLHALTYLLSKDVDW